MNFIWINVPQIALAYSENPNSICLSIQKLFKKQWRTLLKKSDISFIAAHLPKFSIMIILLELSIEKKSFKVLP